MKEMLLSVGIKVNIIFVLLICFQQPVHAQTAQVTNGDFELWATCPCDPPGWITNNVYEPFVFLVVGPGEPYAGNSGITGWVDSSARFSSVIAPEITSGDIQINFRPETLNGYYKFLPVGGDKFKANISLYKNTILIGEGLLEDSTSVSEYTEFIIDINYTSEELPDVAVITFTIDSSEVDEKLHIGSQFSLDELFFDNVSNVSIHDSPVPEKAFLFQNYPNPFNPATTIQFAVPKRSQVTLTLFDLLGREVATLVDDELQPGEFKLIFDVSGLASGVYLYQLKAEGFVRTRKLTLLK